MAAARLDDLLLDEEITDEEMAAAAATEAAVDDEQAYGAPGPPIDRTSPFFVGMAAAFGVGMTVLAAAVVYFTRGLLLDLLVALFVATGLDPVVAVLNRRMPRPAAVLLVIVGLLGALAAVLDLVIPVLVTQIGHLVAHLPRYFAEINNRNSAIGRFNTRYGIESHVRSALSGGSGSIASGVFGIGRVVLGALTSAVVVLVVSVYLLFDLPRFKRLLYGLAPRSRRARVVLLGDEIFAKVGRYVLGNVAISIITGIGTWAWATAFGIPYGLLLGVVVAILDLVPVVGSTVGGVIVALVALSVSLPVALGTLAFYVIYRLVEDYLLSPRIMLRAVDVPGLVTVIATLVGGVLLGIVGALIAIPVAAAVKLILEEVVVPRIEAG